MCGTEEPERKRQKSTLLEQVVVEECKTREDKTTAVENVENEVETFAHQQNVFGSC